MYEVHYAHDITIYHINVNSENEVREMMKKKDFWWDNPKIITWDGYEDTILHINKIKE